MRTAILAAALAAACATSPSAPKASAAPPADDPYLWLEDVGGERALAWVKERRYLQDKATRE